MGKFSDAIEKATVSTDKRPRPKKRLHKLASTKDKPIELSSQSKKMIDELRLESDVCQYLPMHETLVACRKDGNREADFVAEQYKMLCSQILFPMGKLPPRTMLVTSAIPDEGKSTVVSNLAISIALGIRENVLLIECDLRKPTLSNIFGVNVNRLKGLTNYLMGEDRLENLLHKTQIERLNLLPAGQRPANPYELLSSNRMTAMLQEVKSRYDDRYILLDTAPVQLAAETSVLGRFVDGIIFVVGCGKSSRKLIEESLKKFEEEKLLGFVLNNYEGKYTNEYYYRYYGKEKKRFRDKIKWK